MDRELDVRVAEALGYYVTEWDGKLVYATDEEICKAYEEDGLLGWDDGIRRPGEYVFCEYLPKFSKHWSDANRIVWALRKGHWKGHDPINKIDIRIFEEWARVKIYGPGFYGRGAAKELPEAVCRAFLKAARGNDDN